MQVELRDAFDPADAAAGAAGQRAPVRLQRHERLLRHGEPHFGAAGPAFGFDVEDVGRALDDPFAQREAEAERVEVDRRRHHHGVRDAVEHECNRRLVDDAIDGAQRVAGTMTRHMTRAAAGRIVGAVAGLHAVSPGGIGRHGRRATETDSAQGGARRRAGSPRAGFQPMVRAFGRVEDAQRRGAQSSTADGLPAPKRVFRTHIFRPGESTVSAHVRAIASIVQNAISSFTLRCRAPRSVQVGACRREAVARFPASS
ncbi:hypothetical protein BamIOP4010DRAFT_3965 [Burkholderia ambifaria IOP40-10]|uniref:Uncharacterized protein n=1 Tax=Burkholderia ambifaria IOP40-10 TaxID=396596 RepID=B1FIV5_9BURK|nr:hypothetical protein BamIOP4010DRAFT_3965 [Burkholderia ambifaria IOP40-10]